jgi:hypothetical protein
MSNHEAIALAKIPVPEPRSSIGSPGDEKSACHVYLARKSDDVVVIVSIWGARRRRGPKL